MAPSLSSSSSSPSYASALTTTPPPTPNFPLLLSFPRPRVLLITLNRPSQLNCISQEGGAELTRVLAWLDSEPALTVGVITGAGERAFCAGADLKEWEDSVSSSATGSASGSGTVISHEKGVGLSRRRGKKPVVAAVNGLALGGGTEFAVNCDLVVAADGAEFGLPEVTRGLIPFAGVLPRLIRSIGLQRASEFALTGRRVGAKEALAWGFVNKVVPRDRVVEEALALAETIAQHSPDAIIAARAGLREGWVVADVEDAVQKTMEGEWRELQKGENMREGLKAFKERRKATWGKSRL